MTTYEAIKTRIYNLCKEKGITINKLAYTSGISMSSLKNILYGKSTNPGVITIKILCDGLNISLKEFFDAKIFNDLEQEIK